MYPSRNFNSRYEVKWLQIPVWLRCKELTSNWWFGFPTTVWWYDRYLLGCCNIMTSCLFQAFFQLKQTNKKIAKWISNLMAAFRPFTGHNDILICKKCITLKQGGKKKYCSNRQFHHQLHLWEQRGYNRPRFASNSCTILKINIKNNQHDRNINDWFQAAEGHRLDLQTVTVETEISYDSLCSPCELRHVPVEWWLMSSLKRLS